MMAVTANTRKIIKKRLIVIAALTSVIILLIVASGYPLFIEHYYSEGLYPVVCYILHPIFNLFPFSVGDIAYMVVVMYLVYAAVRLVRQAFRKEFREAGAFLLKLVIGIEVALLIFYLFWGMNYFRPSAGELLNLRDTSYTTAGLKTVTEMLIDSANATRSRVTHADFAQNNRTIYQNAIVAVNQLNTCSAMFRTWHPEIKSSILTPLLNYLGTSGYYNPFTSESQMNAQMPVFDRPVTACHELSHQMGFGAEDEANFVGFLAGIDSKDRLLRYSAYHMAVDEFMHALHYRDSTLSKQLRPRISAAVHNDFKAERTYWLSYEGPIDVVTGIFYDNFLKVNNQPQGLETYNRMVLLVMAMYNKKAWPAQPQKSSYTQPIVQPRR